MTAIKVESSTQKLVVKSPRVVSIQKAGPQGPRGFGWGPGGLTGQVAGKLSDNDYDFGWIDAASSVADLTDVTLPASAVGHVLAVAEVDENDVPTAWSVSDIATQVEMDAHTEALNHPYLDVANVWTEDQNFSGKLLPSLDGVYGLGGSAYRWRHGYFGGNSAVVPLTIKAATGQTTNHLDIQNSVGTSLVYVDQYGILNTSRTRTRAPLANQIPMIVSGFASQTANLQEWQDSSGMVKAAIEPDGTVLIDRQSAIVFDHAYRAGIYGNGGYPSFKINGNTIATIGQAVAGMYQPIPANTGPSYLGAPNGLSVGHLSTAYNALSIQQQNNPGSGHDIVVYNNNFTQEKFSVNNGQIVTSGNVHAGGNINAGWTGGTGHRIFSWAASPGNVANVFRGAAGQSADIQQWQDSAGSPVASIAADGKLLFGAAGDVNLYRESATILRTDDNLKAATYGPTSSATRYDGYFGDYTNAGNLDPSNLLKTAYPAYKVLVVRGAASQTANLQEWQDSAGTVGTHITEEGKLVVGGFGSGGGELIMGKAGNSFSMETVSATTSYMIPNYRSFQFKTKTGSNLLFEAYSDNGSPQVGFFGATPGSQPAIGPSREALQSLGLMDSGGFVSGDDIAYQSKRDGDTGPRFEIDADGTIRWGNGSGSTWTDIKGYSSGILVERIGAGIVPSGAGIHVKKDAISLLSEAIVDSSVPIVSRGSASQTANLQEWQDSAGDVKATISSSGFLGVRTESPEQPIHVIGGGADLGGIRVDNTGSGATLIANRTDGVAMSLHASPDTSGFYFTNNGDFAIRSYLNNHRSHILNGGLSGNSYTDRLTINGASGEVDIPGDITLGQTEVDALGVNKTPGSNWAISAASGDLGVIRAEVLTAVDVGVRVIAAPSQTANLQEWKDSANNLKSWVSPTGQLSMNHSIGGEVLRITNDQNPVIGLKNIATIQSTHTLKLQYGSVFPVNGAIVEGLKINASGISFLGEEVSTKHVTRSPTGADLWHGTQAEYDALGTYDDDTVYVVTA